MFASKLWRKLCQKFQFFLCSLRLHLKIQVYLFLNMTINTRIIEYIENTEKQRQENESHLSLIKRQPMLLFWSIWFIIFYMQLSYVVGIISHTIIFYPIFFIDTLPLEPPCPLLSHPFRLSRTVVNFLNEKKISKLNCSHIHLQSEICQTQPCLAVAITTTLPSKHVQGGDNYYTFISIVKINILKQSILRSIV